MIDESKLLQQVDERVRALGKRVGDHEELKQQICDLKTYVACFSENNDARFKSVDKNAAYVCQKCQELEDKNKDLDHSIDDVRKSNQRLAADILADRQDIHHLHKKIDELKNKISESDKKWGCLNSSFLDLKDRFSAVNDHLQGIESALYQQQERFECLSLKIQDANKFCLACFNQLKEENQNLSSQIAKLDSMDLKLLKQFNKDLNDLDSKTHESISSLDSKISSIRIPSIDHLASRDSVNNLMRSIELASLDAKNAFLKSNNNEVHNQILTKKIETLQIALKTHELGNAK